MEGVWVRGKGDVCEKYRDEVLVRSAGEGVWVRGVGVGYR